MRFAFSLSELMKMSSIERWTAHRYDAQRDDEEPPTEVNKKAAMQNAWSQQRRKIPRKKWLLWVPKIDKLPPSANLSERERERERDFDAGICSYSGWMWEQNRRNLIGCWRWMLPPLPPTSDTAKGVTVRGAETAERLSMPLLLIKIRRRRRRRRIKKAGGGVNESVWLDNAFWGFLLTDEILMREV